MNKYQLTLKIENHRKCSCFNFRPAQRIVRGTKQWWGKINFVKTRDVARIFWLKITHWPIRRIYICHLTTSYWKLGIPINKEGRLSSSALFLESTLKEQSVFMISSFSLSSKKERTKRMNIRSYLVAGEKTVQSLASIILNTIYLWPAPNFKASKL